MSATELVESVGTPVPAVPQFDHDPYCDEVGCNPYPYYTKIREAGPVGWLSRYGVYVSARDSVVRECLNNWKQFSSALGIGPLKKKALNDFREGSGPPPATGLLEYDPPEHGAARRHLVKLLTNKALSELRGAFAVSAAALAKELCERTVVDGVDDIVHRYILEVMGDAVGLPKEGRHHLYIFGELAMNLPGPINDRVAKSHARVVQEGTMEWIAKTGARESLSPKGLGAQLYAMADAGEITMQEAGGLVGVFLAAAVDSTSMTIINGLHSFALFPDQWKLLHDDPGMARQAFEEVLRYRPSPQTLFRTTTCEVDIEGVRLPAGIKVGSSVAGANRDPRRWEDPDKFDIRRKATGHLAFGNGVHACLGQMVARMEADCLLSEMARRIRTIEFAGEPVPFANNAMSTFSKLPLRLTAA